MPHASADRSFSLFELMIYMFVWTIIIGIVGMNGIDVPVIVRAPLRIFGATLLLAPGALVGGPVGLLIWGRRAFFRGALFGILVWIPVLVYPALDAVR